MTITVPLNGTWQLLPVDSFRQGFYPLDDDAWVAQELPAHWQQHPLLARYVGRMVYRRRFSRDELALPEGVLPQNPRYWLRLNGVFYWSQPYFNAIDLGRHEGYFAPQEHEITAWLDEQNTLLVEVECPDEHDKFGKRLITGVFSHWDCIDPTSNPGGIWLPVELLATGPVRISEVLLRTERLGDRAAELRFHTTLDAAQATDVTLRWTVAPKNFAGEVQVIEQRRALAAGVQEVAGALPVRDPQLWWTHDMGHPSCYTVTLEVLLAGAVSDTRSQTFGIRRFELRGWIAYLNGVRFFIKGNNYAPGDVRIATMTRERYTHDFALAQACHMNMLRVHAHVEHPLFYELADECGMLLWQDFPLQWLYRHSILPEAERQAHQMLRLLGNHPAVALWCMHNEPIRVADLADERLLTKLRTYFSVFAWSWNRDVLDSRLKRLAERADPSRPAIRSSGEYAVPLLRPGTDAHYYYGWLSIYGPLRAWETLAWRFPANLRFVSEFGAQSFPNLESSTRFMDADIERIDWDELAARHQFLPSSMGHWYPWRSAASLAALVEQTQTYQALVNRFYIDRLRQRKYRPTGGILPFMFRDTGPAVQSSIIDYWGVPKQSYYAMQTAFSPQYVWTLLDQDRYVPGAAIDLPIYIVNDAHRAVPVELRARITGPTGATLAELTRSLTLPADCMAMEAERLRLRPELPGDYRLALALHEPDGAVLVAHDYVVEVVGNGQPLP